MLKGAGLHPDSRPARKKKQPQPCKKKIYSASLASWRLFCAAVLALLACWAIIRGLWGADLPPARDPQELAVWWHGPFFSSSGYGTEAVDFVLGLDRIWNAGVWITQHGDLESEKVFRSYTRTTQKALMRMATHPTHKRPTDAIVVCHSEPGAWSVPTSLYKTTRCPPEPVEQVPWVIGRTMFESDRISEEHVRRLNAMDEVWVPTEWQRQVFSQWGVAREKLAVVPEAVDSSLYDPTNTQPLPLPIGKLVFGPARAKHGGTIPADDSSLRMRKFVTGINWRRRRMQGQSDGTLGAGPAARAERRTQHSGDAARRDGQQPLDGAPEPFVFLSSFKWEARKGWDVLLEAYLKEFSSSDPVMLVLVTKPFYTDTDFASKMHKWADEHLPQSAASHGGSSGGAVEDGEVGGLFSRGVVKNARVGAGSSGAGRVVGHAGAQAAAAAGASAYSSQLPTVYIVHDFLPQQDLIRLYKAADCFVIASRGEGWGRPHVEAMSMELPVIATNWSGPTAFLDESVGYPLATEGLVDTGPDSGVIMRLVPERTGAFLGHKWAQPSTTHLRKLMRHVTQRRQEAADRGQAARRRMVERYAPSVVAQTVAEQLLRARPRMVGS